MTSYIALGSAASVPLERLAAEHHMRITAFEEPDDAEHPPPRGSRVLTIDRCGSVATDWQWAEQVYWPDTFAFVVQDVGGFAAECDGCGAVVAADQLSDIEEGLSGAALCEDCLGDAELEE